MADPRLRGVVIQLERRLAEQRAALDTLGHSVRRMRRVYDAAKRYVLSPYIDGTEERLAKQLEEAVLAAVEAERG